MGDKGERRDVVMKDSLFSAGDEVDSTAPLAARMRPRDLDEMVGQEELLAQDSLFRRRWRPTNCPH
jgi:replication-associated recombination protein RarA